MGSRKLGRQQVEAGSQGPTARLITASCSESWINRMLWFHLVRRFVVLLARWHRLAPRPIRHRRKQVASDSPGYSRDAVTSSSLTLQGKAGENGQPGGCLCKSSIQETVGYAGGKLPAGVANDWVTRRSPVLCFAELRVITDACSSLAPLAETSSRGGRRLPHCVHGMVAQCTLYSLACRTPGTIPREYCSLRDRGA